MSDLEKSRESYLRVTNILYPFSGLDKVDTEIVANAAKRGSLVHKICEGIVTGLGEFGITEETKGYVESFKSWWGQGHEVIACEERFYDDENQFTGQVDSILKKGNELFVVDYKTSSKPSKTWPAQGSAYGYLARKAGFDVKKTLFIHLNKHGNDAKIYEYPIDESLFFACFRVFKHFYV